MKSNLTKITIATVLAITTLTGLALYVKANILTEESVSEEYSYMLKSDATTDLNAITKAHARTAEYTSAEYADKMAPIPSAASGYLAMYDDNPGSGGYKRRSAPTSISGSSSNRQVSTGESYGGYAVRSAGGKDIQTTKTDYEQTLNSANENDNAYQAQKVESDKKSYGGYAVRSAEGKDRQSLQAQTPSTGESYGGYAVRSASYPQNSMTATSNDDNQLAIAKSYEENSIKTEKTKEVQTALADNANRNDRAYQAPSTGESYGGYAVRSAGGKDRQSLQAQKAPSTGESYGGYAVRSAGGKDIQTTQTATTSAPARNVDNEYGGYAVRSAEGKDRQSLQAQTSSTGETYGGYAVRSAGGKDIQTTQYDLAAKNDDAYKVSNTQVSTGGESYGGYAVRSAGGKDRKNIQENQTAQSSETYGGYAVRSAGKKENQNLQANSRIVASTKKVGRKGGVPSSAGVKVYSNKGHRMSIDISQRDRNVIIMPVRGRSIAGVVIQDDPGRSIIVQSTSGSQSTYRYGEIDALVNL